MLRDYQHDLKQRIYEAWHAGHRNVIATMATGGGKAVLNGAILQEFDGPAAVTVHRSPLVSQLALTLNREHVPHSIIAPKQLIREIIRLEVDTHGKSFYRATAPIRVASTKTLANRDGKDRWFDQCKLALVDEGHHVLADSEVARALHLLPNAWGLFVTAHACRADGLGLGRATKENPERDGLADALVVGPHARYLIDRGFLCDWDIRCPPLDIDISDIPIGASGDLVQKTLRERVHASKVLVGSIVKEYKRRCEKEGRALLGLTFVVDKEEADKTCKAFREAGVPTEIVTDDTSIAARAIIMKQFAAGKLRQLVSVDVLGEGVDVPAVEIISLGRHTESWQVFCQQMGRGTRPLITDAAIWEQWGNLSNDQRIAAIARSPKPRFYVHDHVGNVMRHYLRRGSFDSQQEYTLDRRSGREKRDPNAIKLRTCQNEECFKPYSAILLRCPYCQTMKPPPDRRGAPEQVEGDLEELDFAILKAMRGEIERIDGAPTIPHNVTGIVAESIRKNHYLRQVAQAPLREAIALWSGWQRDVMHLQDREIYRLFWHRFGIDIASAQVLGAREAGELQSKIRAELERNNIVRLDHGTAAAVA